MSRHHGMAHGTLAFRPSAVTNQPQNNNAHTRREGRKIIEVLKLRLFISELWEQGRKKERLREEKKEAIMMIMAAQPSAIESNPRDTRAAPFPLCLLHNRARSRGELLIDTDLEIVG